jgi:hypothetical protein
MTSRADAVIVQPPDHPNGLPLSRSVTLEAQRFMPTKARGLRSLVQSCFAKDDVSDDPVEAKLKIAILESSGDERAFLEELERHYAVFRNNPGHAVANDIFRCWTFQEAASDGTIQSRSSAHQANWSCAEISTRSGR